MKRSSRAHNVNCEGSNVQGWKKRGGEEVQPCYPGALNRAARSKIAQCVSATARAFSYKSRRRAGPSGFLSYGISSRAAVQHARESPQSERERDRTQAALLLQPTARAALCAGQPIIFTLSSLSFSDDYPPRSHYLAHARPSLSFRFPLSFSSLFCFRLFLLCSRVILCRLHGTYIYIRFV